MCMRNYINLFYDVENHNFVPRRGTSGAGRAKREGAKREEAWWDKRSGTSEVGRSRARRKSGAERVAKN